jgi:hypothetical protein
MSKNSDEIKPRRVWITRDFDACTYEIHFRNPVLTALDGSWMSWGRPSYSMCPREASRLFGPIPEHVKRGGPKAIARGYIYLAADWEDGGTDE